MAFSDADAYDSFMGRFSVPLAAALVEALPLTPGRTALDVGCGTGALTQSLVALLGADAVTAADPSSSFVAAARQRMPDVNIVVADAEHLPFDTGTFDATLAQLVVHFMPNPVAGIAEMGRVTRPGGIVAASVWDFAGDRSPLSVFWRAVREQDAGARDESGLAGARAGDLEWLFERAGLTGVTASELEVRLSFDDVEQWWEPFTLGVGPAGDYLATLSPARRDAIRQRCGELLPAGPFDITAVAWLAQARR